MSASSRSSPPQWPAIIALVVALGGVPAATAWAFAEQITANPWRAAAVAIVYLLGVFVVGVLTKIWQRLEAPWLDQAARWIDGLVRRRLSRYERRYRRFMVEQHRFFDVKGLTTQGPYSLMLNQVFVELSLAAQPAHLVSNNPLSDIPKALRAGQHNIWAYLQAKQMRGQHLAVLGAPGSGKTTLLRHIALVLASGKHPTGIFNLRRLPILLFLRDHAAAITANPQMTLAAAIGDHLSRQGGPPPPPEWFERQLAAGVCVVMLDGLDEVADLTQRQQVVQWVDRQTATHAVDRFIVTSRPFGVRNTPLDRVTVLEVRAFTRPQVERFVTQWYLANEIMSTQRDDDGVRRDARRGAEDLLARLRNTQNLADLAINPLLLTMIANVHRYSSSLPERRVELYREICTVFLGKRQQARGMAQQLTPPQKQLVLQALAYGMMQRQIREIALDDALPLIREPIERISLGLNGEIFLKQIEEGSGLLIEREDQHYSFAHLTFQEYLAATHILEQQLEQELVEHTTESWWHETILLYVAQTDASAIVEACMSSAMPSIEALTLAIDCNEEARELRPEIRTRLEALLAQGVEDPDHERRWLIAEALLARRLRRMIRLDDQRAVDTSLLSHAEYQLFLDECIAQDNYHQPDHWQDAQFPAGQGHAPVLGMRLSDAVTFCAWLTQRSGGTWSYRLPRRDELLREIGSQPQRTAQANRLICWSSEPSSASINLSSSSPAPVWIEERILEDTQDFVVRVVTLWVYDIDALDRASTLASDLARALASARDRASAHASDLAFASDLARASALASDLAHDLASDRARNRDRVRDLASAFASDHDRALASALASASDRALASDRAHDRARDRARVLASDLVLDLANDRARALARASASAHDFAHDLAHDRARASASADDLAHDLARALGASVTVSARALARALASARERALTSTNARFFASARTLASDLASANALNRAHDLIQGRITAYQRSSPGHQIGPLNLDRWCTDHVQLDPRQDIVRIHRHEEQPTDDTADLELLNRVVQLTLDRALGSFCRRSPTTEQGTPVDYAPVRWAIRCIALFMIDEIDANRDSPSWVKQVLLRSDEMQADMQRLRDEYMDLYSTFAILEERIAGSLPPCEGILLIRELPEPSGAPRLTDSKRQHVA